MMDPALIEAVKHYLVRTGAVLEVVATQPAADALLHNKLAPDMFDASFNLAIALKFAGRALCPPAGLSVPEIPDVITLKTLRAYHVDITNHIAQITAADLTRSVTHTAGDATVTQEPADYIARFALPNQIFHLTTAYAILRQAGVPLGKADFDDLHRY